MAWWSLLIGSPASHPLEVQAMVGWSVLLSVSTQPSPCSLVLLSVQEAVNLLNNGKQGLILKESQLLVSRRNLAAGIGFRLISFAYEGLKPRSIRFYFIYKNCLVQKWPIVKLRYLLVHRHVPYPNLYPDQSPSEEWSMEERFRPLTFHGLILRSQLVTLLIRGVCYNENQSVSVHASRDYDQSDQCSRLAHISFRIYHNHDSPHSP